VIAAKVTAEEFALKRIISFTTYEKQNDVPEWNATFELDYTSQAPLFVEIWP
jgi:hypothetical protein